MCFVVQNHLGKGARCAPPLHPPGLWLRQGIQPTPKPLKRFAARPRAGDITLPAPIDTEGVPAPVTLDQFMEMPSAGPWKGSLALPCPGRIPSTKGPSSPCGTLTNPARIGCRHLAEDGSLLGTCRPPRTQLVGPGEAPLHRHRTMHNRSLG